MPVRTFATCLMPMQEHIPLPPEIPPLTPNLWGEWTEYREADADAPQRSDGVAREDAPHRTRIGQRRTARRVGNHDVQSVLDSTHD